MRKTKKLWKISAVKSNRLDSSAEKNETVTIQPNNNETNTVEEATSILFAFANKTQYNNTGGK